MVLASAGTRFLLVILLLVVSIGVFGVAFYKRALFASPVDCMYAPWPKVIEWGECSSDCHGVQFATRSVMREAIEGGKECIPSDAIKSQSCNLDVPCFESCIPGDPTKIPWTTCPVCMTSDVHPVQWKVVPPLRPATLGGTDCSLEQVFQTRPCEGFIPACPPSVDCEFQISEVGPCNVLCGSGTQNVYYTVSQFPQGNGAPCNPALLTVQESCYIACDCPTFSGDFSTCNAACGPGIQVRLLDGPVASTCSNVETRICSISTCENNTCFPPSVEYIQALCILSCSGLPLPEFAPGVCSTTAMFDAICPTGGAFNPCAEPQDCSLSTWSTYSECSVPFCNSSRQEGGTRTTVRSIVKNAVGGGTQCIQELLYASEPCNNWASISYEALDTLTNSFTASISSPECSITKNCQYSSWYPVNPCNAPCAGSGSITYFRSITQFPDSPFAGDQCTKSLVLYELCINDTACQPCVWTDPDTPGSDFQLTCGFQELGFISQAVQVATASNIPGVDCRFSGETCSLDTRSIPNGDQQPYPPGKNPDGSWRTLSCSSYGKVCNGFSTCPHPNNVACNGFGTPIETLQGCTCSCFSGWSGRDCTTFSGTLCPVGSNSQLCSGVGTCNFQTGTCSCPNGDTSPDCSKQALAWCWVFADFVMIPSANENWYINDYWSMRKMIGAFPILDSAYGSFSTEDCISITSTGDWGASSLTHFLTLTKPSPLLQDTPLIHTPENSGVFSFSSARFSGQIRSEAPATLLHDWFRYCDMSEDDALLALHAPHMSQFIHRILPGSYPTRCESLFTQSYLLNGQNVQQNAVQLLPVPEAPFPGFFSIDSATTGFNTYQFQGTTIFYLNTPNSGYPAFPAEPYLLLPGFQHALELYSSTLPSLSIPIEYKKQLGANPFEQPTNGCIAGDYLGNNQFVCSNDAFAAIQPYVSGSGFPRTLPSSLTLFGASDFFNPTPSVHTVYINSVVLLDGNGIPIGLQSTGPYEPLPLPSVEGNTYITITLYDNDTGNDYFLSSYTRRTDPYYGIACIDAPAGSPKLYMTNDGVFQLCDAIPPTPPNNDVNPLVTLSWNVWTYL